MAEFVEFWKEDAAAVELMTQARAAEDAADKSKKLARALREQAAARMRDLVPSPDKICEDAEAMKVHKLIGHGLYHWTHQEQPADAWLNHHCAFGLWVTDWVYLEFTHFIPVGRMPTLEPGYDFVRVGLKVRSCSDPTGSGNHLTGWPPNWKERLEKWVADACSLVRILTRDMPSDQRGDWSGPLDSWGGGEWTSLVCKGPVHPSYLNAARNSRNNVGKEGWDKIIPPTTARVDGQGRAFVWEV